MDPVSTLAIKPMIDGIVSKIVIPKLEKLATRVGLEYNKLLVPKGEHFSEYLYRTYKRYSVINTLVLRNNQRSLKDLYVPLTLSIDKTAEKRSLKIEGYPQSIINEYQKVLVTDTAGMGKSTLAKRMFLDIIDNGYGIPIFIELRRLSKERSLLYEIQQQLNSLSKEFDAQLMLDFLQLGGFIFFLDGYDEIALSERDIVTQDLQDFVSKASENIYILTSRPETALSSFGDFQKTTIEPLKKKEAYELLRKYDNQGETSRSLIDKLKSPEYSMIEDFLKNPLLVSLLFAAYDYKQTIPLKKHIFYRQVYDAHFDSHDLSKGDGFIHEKKSNLDIDDFDKVLRFIGFECLKRQKIEFAKDELLDIVENAKRFCVGLRFSASDFLDDLLKSVPLFCKDGTYYKWAHKSLQEYFAAQFIFKDIKENQDKILSAIYESSNMEKYYNMLDIYYDIDIFSFRKNILLPLLKDYNLYFGKKESSDDINVQKGLLFNRDTYIIVLDKDEGFSKTIELVRSEFEVIAPRRAVTIQHKECYIYCIESGCTGAQKRILLNILFNKKNDFIKNYSRSRSLDNILILEKSKPYHVTPEITNPLNVFSLWKEVNYLISSVGSRSDGLYIDLNSATLL